MIEEIKNFLREKPGYLKKSASALAERFFAGSYTEDDLLTCASALLEVKREVRGTPVTVSDSDFETESTPQLIDGLVLKSAWQTASGEMRYSYAKPTSKDIDLGEFQSVKEELLNTLTKTEHSPVKIKEHHPHKDSVLLEISLPDLHFGKGDTEELIFNFASSVSELLAQTDSTYNIERILFPIGNDGMNSEGKRASTTKGTFQHDSLGWKQSFVLYCNAIKQAVGLAKTYAPVDVVVIAGNHDQERMLYAGEVIKAYFNNDALVTVNNNFDARKFYQYGEVGIMYTHGDKEKPADLALIFATEKPEVFATSKHREIHCGHFHKEMILEETRSIKTRFLPSICTTDEWHEEMGYSHYRTAQGLVWHKNEGLKAIFQHNI